MLREIPNHMVSQIRGEPHRRWFRDSYFDLLVWEDEAGEFTGFQMCYDISGMPKAITWSPENGFSHHRVDLGDDAPGKVKGTPILVANGKFDPDEFTRRFRKRCGNIDPEVAAYILGKLSAY